jgi:hypothetical protein
MKKELELHLFVEGKYDILFYKAFLDRYLRETFQFNEIFYYPYAEKQAEREKLVQIIKRNPKSNYLICSDLDAEFDETIRQQKIKMLANTFKIDSEIVQHKVFAVVIEIESWYLAGFDKAFYQEQKIEDYYYKDTEQTTKGVFKKIVKMLKIDEFQWRDRLTKMYKHRFCIEEAKNRNESFSKFLQKVAIQIKQLS